VEGGKFIIAVLLAIVLAGGAYYMNSKEIDVLQAQVAALQGKINPIQTNAVNAGALANAAKAAADGAKADAAKANDAVTALTTTVTEMQKAPAAAKRK
jgi:uncharacterized protein HemX